MSADVVYLVGGLALLLGVVLPAALRGAALSAPIVLVTVGALIGLLPAPGGERVSPVDHLALTEHLTEFAVLVALMGVGLAIDRPLRWRSWTSWRSWSPAWRLLAIGMPLSIAGGALLGWVVMGLAPAAALLLGAVMAPTDPVLAADIQVEGPTEEADGAGEVDEDDEVRFALTSEAGLNDGLAFPFVQAAMLAAGGGVGTWWWHWLAWELVGKVAIGAVVGAVCGLALARVAFRAPRRSLRLAETGEPLLALAATVLTYGVAEVLGGYGFLAVFTGALALRSAERGHEYHALMHQVVERLERLLTLVVLLLLGVALTDGLLANLTWPGATVAVLLVAVVRPVTAWVSLLGGAREDRVADGALGPRERAVTAFFGVRGVGSVYYLAYALGHADFGDVDRVLWSTVTFTIVLSVLVHGVAATPAMAWLERVRTPQPVAGTAPRAT
ncbi:MAG: cation:proton antiporter [Actinobacteria bacterium]|nr:cation:proton antiporter [Actinomycetota bacterium]